MPELEDVLQKLCPLLSKESQELSEGERKTLLGLLSKTVIFMNKANIVPYPDTFYRWFLVYCYLLNRGIKNPSYDTIFKTYDYVDEILEKTELTSQETDSQHRLHKLLIIELERLIEHIHKTMTKAQEEIISHIKRLTQKDTLSPEEISSFLETMKEIEKSLKDEIEAILAKLKGIQSRIEDIGKRVSLEITECMKPNVFKAIVKRLIDRCVNTGSLFSLVLIRINRWSEWQRLPEEYKVEFLNNLCRSVRLELRSYDYVTCFKDQGILAVVIRNVGIKTAHRVMQRIVPLLENTTMNYKGKKLTTSYALAIVEGRGILPYGKLMEKARKVLELCPDDETSIRSEVDLVGK